MERTNSRSWLKFVGALVLVAVIVLVIVLVYPKNEKKGNNSESIFNNNLNTLMDAGVDYFKSSNLPTEIGRTKEVTLRKLIDLKEIGTIYDESNKSCSLDGSFVEAKKVLDNEYSLKAYLSCDNKTDYLNRTLEINLSNNNTNLDNNQNSSLGGNSGVVNQLSSTNTDNNSTNTNSNSSSNTNTNTSSNNSNTNTSSNTSSNKNTNSNSSRPNTGTLGNSCSGLCCDGKCPTNIYFTVTFDSNGGNYVAPQRVKDGQTAIYASTSREGYNFLGWTLDGNIYNFATPVHRQITLVAKWEKANGQVPKNQYTVSFNSNGGSNVPSQNVDEGGYAYNPGNPTRECYTFVAWHVGSVNGRVYNFNEPVYANMTLVAEWKYDYSCAAKYTVSFNSNGGSNVPSQSVNEGGYAYRPGNPTRECYTFVAWHVGSVNGRVYNFNEPVYADMTLVAEWKYDYSCVTSYTVSFDSNGGTYVGSQSVVEGNRATQPANPTRSGYNFLGWYYNNQKFDFNTRIYKNYTLVAKWEKISNTYNYYCKIKRDRIYSIGYIPNGMIEGITSKTVTYTTKSYYSNIKSFKVVEYGNIKDGSEYINAYNYNKSVNKNLGAVGMTGGIDTVSWLNLKNHSLKANNLTPKVEFLAKEGNYYYMDITLNLKRLNNITDAEKYYPNANSKDYIYYLPLYFDVEYTDLNNCAYDLSSNWTKYSGYEVLPSDYFG